MTAALENGKCFKDTKNQTTNAKIDVSIANYEIREDDYIVN